MAQNILVRILLAPFSLLYGIGVSIHRFLYRKGVLKSVHFDVPVIAVGNLTVGGSGKTPHIEYLIRLLKDYLPIGTISRGYRRKTKGYLTIERHMNAEQAGDEPLQFKRKFPEIMVSVAENRVLGIPQMLMEREDIQTILMDDAFQHRAVQPGLNILLTNYDLPFTRDYLLPAGRLREWRSGYERADVIIVSKCPKEMDQEKRDTLIKEINPFANQKVFFSYYEYFNPYFLLNPSQRIKLDEELDVLVLCAIANTSYLLDYLDDKVGYVAMKAFEDHHPFSETDLSNLKKSFEKFDSKRKIILTTEKDAVRLEIHRKYLIENQLPVFVLPIQVKFHFGEATDFDNLVKNYLLNFKV